MLGNNLTRSEINRPCHYLWDNELEMPNLLLQYRHSLQRCHDHVSEDIAVPICDQLVADSFSILLFLFIHLLLISLNLHLCLIWCI